MSAQQQNEEADRLWMALDALTRQVQDLDLRMVREARVPVTTQLAPSPDYRMGEPIKLVFDEVGAEGPCSCEEAVALRKQLRGVLDEAGISADVDEGRDPLDAARSLRRDLNSAQDEGVALRAEVERLQGVLAQVNAHALAKMQETAAANALLTRVADDHMRLGDDWLDDVLAAQPATAPRMVQREG